MPPFFTKGLGFPKPYTSKTKVKKIMIFNVTVDLTRIHDGEKLDTILEEKIVEEVADKVAKELKEKQGEILGKAAEKLIRAKTEYFIDNFLEQPITINEGWNKRTKYGSLYDMVEQQISSLYTGKVNSKGTCEEDPFLGRLKEHIKFEVNNLLTALNKRIELNAKTAAAAELAENKMIAALDAALPKLPARR